MSDATPVPDDAVDDHDTGSHDTSDPLLERLRRIEDLPLRDRADAFEALNRTLVGALHELEQL